MAGDWIKMRGNLWDDPRVSRLCDLTGQTEAAIVGGLYWLWATADQHTENGVMPGLTVASIDRKTGIKGLGDGLALIGWIADHPEGIRIVNFEEHNGASAKRRSEDAKRKSEVRKTSDKTRTDAGISADILGGTAELEKEKSKSKRKEGESRATRIPPNFEPAPEPDAESGINRATELANFRDYWTAKSGAGATKLDWQATWRQWARKAHRKPADIARQTVPGPTARDPALVKLDEDARKAAPIPLAQLEKMAALRAAKGH